MVRALLAAESASSFPGMPQWPGTHWIPIVVLQVDNRARRAFTEASKPTSALHIDWLSVMMSGLEEWSQLSAIHEIARSRALHSSSNELVNAAPLARRVSKRGGSSWMWTTAAAPPCLQPSIAEPSVKMVRSELQLEMARSAAARMVSWLSALLVMPSRLGKMVVKFSDCQGGLEMSCIGSLLSASGGRKLSLSSFPFLAQLLRLFLGGMADVNAMCRGWLGGEALG